MKKKYIIFAITILILFVVLLFNLLFIAKKKKAQAEENIDNYVYVENKEFYANKIFPVNFYRVELAYDGYQNLNELCEKIYKLVYNYIPELNKFDSKERVMEYYESNAEQISKDIGISNKNDFITFYNKVYINSDTLEYKNCEILLDSAKKTSSQITFDMKITYNEDKEVILNVCIPNSKAKSVTFIK